jgi:hypothetical protein
MNVRQDVKLLLLSLKRLWWPVYWTYVRNNEKLLWLWHVKHSIEYDAYYTTPDLIVTIYMRKFMPISTITLLPGRRELSSLLKNFPLTDETRPVSVIANTHDWMLSSSSSGDIHGRMSPNCLWLASLMLYLDYIEQLPTLRPNRFNRDQEFLFERYLALSNFVPQDVKLLRPPRPSQERVVF